METVANESMEARVTRLVMEYALTTPPLPLDPALTLREDLSIDSLSLVSLTLRLGEEMSFDVVATGLELSRLVTFRDLVELGRSMTGDPSTPNRE
jgi:acyl carrier protein